MGCARVRVTRTPRRTRAAAAGRRAGAAGVRTAAHREPLPNRGLRPDGSGASRGGAMSTGPPPPPPRASLASPLRRARLGDEAARRGARRRRPGARHRPQAQVRARSSRSKSGTLDDVSLSAGAPSRRRAAGGGGARGGGGAAVGVVGRRLDRRRVQRARLWGQGARVPIRARRRTATPPLVQGRRRQVDGRGQPGVRARGAGRRWRPPRRRHPRPSLPSLVALPDGTPALGAGRRLQADQAGAGALCGGPPARGHLSARIPRSARAQVGGVRPHVVRLAAKGAAATRCGAGGGARGPMVGRVASQARARPWARHPCRLRLARDAPSLRTDALGDGVGRTRLLVSRPGRHGRRRPGHALPELRADGGGRRARRRSGCRWSTCARASRCSGARARDAYSGMRRNWLGPTSSWPPARPRPAAPACRWCRW